MAGGAWVIDETLGGPFKDFTPLLSLAFSLCLFFLSLLFLLSCSLTLFLSHFLSYIPSSPLSRTSLDYAKITPAFKTEELSINDSLHLTSPHMEIN